MRQVLWRNKCTLVRRFDKMKTSSPLQITSEYEDKRNEKTCYCSNDDRRIF